MGGNIAVQNILVSDSGVTAISSKVFYDEAIQTETNPFIIVRLESVSPNDTKDGVSHFDFDLVSVISFGSTVLQAYQLASAARTALDRKSAGIYNTISVESIQFQDQRSASEFIDNKKTFINEQTYQVMTRP